MQSYATILLCLAWLALAEDIYLQNPGLYSRDVDTGSGESGSRGKRPFCNAFTGCGKRSGKRSGGGGGRGDRTGGGEGLSLAGTEEEDGMAALVEMGSEPAVEELSRQILSEAKLWEAIQEARMELAGRNHKEREERPLQLPITGGRKRSLYHFT